MWHSGYVYRDSTVLCFFSSSHLFSVRRFASRFYFFPFYSQHITLFVAECVNGRFLSAPYKINNFISLADLWLARFFSSFISFVVVVVFVFISFSMYSVFSLFLQLHCTLVLLLFLLLLHLLCGIRCRWKKLLSKHEAYSSIHTLSRAYNNKFEREE